MQGSLSTTVLSREKGILLSMIKKKKKEKGVSQKCSSLASAPREEKGTHFPIPSKGGK